MKNEFKVSKEWLVNADDNKTAVRPLSFWFEYFGIAPIDGTSWAWSTARNTRCGFIDIEVGGGYGMLHSQYEEHKDDLFFVGNADLARPKLRLNK